MDIPSNLVNEHFNDRYFDVVNALDEAQQIYFDNNNLTERLAVQAASGQPLVIGETGFGAGRIVVSLMEYLTKSQLENIQIKYYSVELHPLHVERMISILSGFTDRAGAEVSTLVEAYRKVDISVPGWHEMRIRQSFGTIKLKLWIGEALEMVQALDQPCDIWFLDGHGPKKNPLIWRPELLMAIGAKTKAGGGCATFTVAGEVKRALSAAGFVISKRPGCGGKNSVLQGRMP